MCNEKNEVISDMIHNGMMANKYDGTNTAPPGMVRVCSMCFTVMPKFGSLCTNVCMDGKAIDVEEYKLRDL
jgi:hypothetical protein